MVDRDIDSSWTDWHPPIMAQIDHDLREQQRPTVSPAIQVAFDGWREAHRAHSHDTIGNDEHDSALCTAEADAACGLLRTPCYTPGDFLVKVYVDQLGEHGSTYYGHDNLPEGAVEGFAFEIDSRALREGLGIVDGEAREVFLRDLDDSDLGACMLALGRIDFDAAAWLSAADRAGVSVYLTEQLDGKSGLVCGTGPDDSTFRLDRVGRVQRLLTGNGGAFGKERVAAVVDHIRAHQTHRLVRRDGASSVVTQPIFEPRQWLTALTEIGGGYALMADRRLFLTTDRCGDDELSDVMAAIAGRPERYEAIKLVIERRQLGEIA